MDDIKYGESRELSKAELEEKEAFEQQKRHLEERAERLKQLSFRIADGKLLISSGSEGWYTYKAFQSLMEELHKTSDGLNLYFDFNEFSTEEISGALAVLSELYRSVGGDRLVIKKSEILEPFYEPETELV